MIYRFGTYELDLATFELRAGGQVCRLEPQVFALLALLVENRERLVSKDEIIEKVWDANLDPFSNVVRVTMVGLRRKLGDHSTIETIVGVGYKL